MTDMEISGNTRHAAIDALIEAGFVDPDDGTVPHWHKGESTPVWTVPARVVDVVLAAALPHLLTEVAVHHYDIEKHAASFNEGYDEANRQRIGGEASRNWLTEKVWPLLKDHIEPENSHHVADQIADALLSEADLDLSEVKSMCETATALGLALGRKQALVDAEAAILAFDYDRLAAVGLVADVRTVRTALAKIVRDMASQASQSVSNGPTASSRHPGTPEAARTRRAGECSQCFRDYDQRPGPACDAPYVHDNPTPALPEESDQ